MPRYVNKSQQGMALITVLLFSQVFAILSLYALEMGILSQRTSRAHWYHFKSFNISERLLQEIELEVAANSASCEISVTHSVELSTNPLSWWQANACYGQIEELEYYYVVETLGIDSCAKLANDKKMSANYFRITLLTVSDKKHVKELLQSTIIKPDNALLECSKKTHQVTLGRQTWRIL